MCKGRNISDIGGKVCIVTGASRGIGRGIALQLLQHGTICYITGRNIDTLEKVKKEAESRGYSGTCIPVQCDHTQDESIQKLFETVSSDHDGQLDLLVNNAYAAVQFMVDNAKHYFWDKPIEDWDVVNNVGLRNHYICSVHASKLMVPRRKGLIINISSIGGLAYFGSPTYGIGKAGKDRMAKDCGAELKDFGVAFVSLWPGPVKTELMSENTGKLREDPKVQWIFDRGETPEYTGKAVCALFSDANIIRRTGQIIMTTDLGDEFSFKDIDDSRPVSMRGLKFMCAGVGLLKLAEWVPHCLRVPFWLFRALITRMRPDTSIKEGYFGKKD